MSDSMSGGGEPSTVSGTQTEIQGDSAGTWVSFAGILALIAAFVAFAVGGFFVWAAPSDPDPDLVRCGEDVMRPGDTCLAFGGDPDDEGIDEGGDYGEMRADRERQARRYDDAHGSASAAFHIGAILLPVAFLLVVVGLVVTALQQRPRRGSHGAASSSR
jgi:hypothetical protein